MFPKPWRLQLTVGLVVLLCPLALPHARAETRIHADAGVTVTVPLQWKVTESTDVMLAVSADERAQVLVLVVTGRSHAELAQGLMRALGRKLEGLRPTGPRRQTTVNGLPATAWQAEGRLRGATYELKLLAAKTPTNRLVLMLAMVDVAGAAADRAAAATMLGSLQPRG